MLLRNDGKGTRSQNKSKKSEKLFWILNFQHLGEQFTFSCSAHLTKFPHSPSHTTEIFITSWKELLCSWLRQYGCRYKKRQTALPNICGKVSLLDYYEIKVTAGRETCIVQCNRNEGNGLVWFE
jgi:hypothetical protein